MGLNELTDAELIRRYESMKGTADHERHRYRLELERRAFARGSVHDEATGCSYEWDEEEDSVVCRNRDADLAAARRRAWKSPGQRARLGRVAIEGAHRVPGKERQIRDDHTTAG